MNRPIKFRVWDKRETKGMSTQNMLYDAQLHHLWQDFVDYPGSYELMQYTGCHDSSKKEIYEGDILSECIDNRTELGICKQILGGWKIFSHPNSSICWHGNQHKVIGNIFESPQLLK
jgi:uncharacterized phage protein (TIGR01671 family)